MLIPLDLIPISAREIGHLDGHTAVGDGGCGQFAEAGPFGGVVDVLVERQAVLQAVDEAVCPSRCPISRAEIGIRSRGISMRNKLFIFAAK